MRREVVHPHRARTVAVVGTDPVLGHWCEVREAGRIVESYDSLCPPEGGSLAGLMQVLVRHGFYFAEDVAEAHRLLPRFLPGEIEDEGMRRAAELLIALRLGAGE